MPKQGYMWHNSYFRCEEPYVNMVTIGFGVLHLWGVFGPDPNARSQIPNASACQCGCPLPIGHTIWPNTIKNYPKPIAISPSTFFGCNFTIALYWLPIWYCKFMITLSGMTLHDYLSSSRQLQVADCHGNSQKTTVKLLILGWLLRKLQIAVSKFTITD